MLEKKVVFRLERVFNKELCVWECVIHREGMETIYSGMAKKDIVLVATVANSMSCVFDNVELRGNDNLEFELTVKVNRE